MSGLLTISKPGATVTGNFSHTSTGGVTLTQSLTVGGNFTLTTSGTFTPGTNTITLTGTSGNTLNLSKNPYNLVIDPSSAATISVTTSDFSVTNQLTVASGDTLSIGS